MRRFSGFLLGLLVTISSASYGQAIVDIENVLNDLVIVSDQYITPAADASVYQSTAAWYSSAKSLDLYEVDVSIHFNALPIGSKKKVNTVRDSEFINLDIRDGATAEVPTALGGDTEQFYDFIIDGETYEMQAFEGIKEAAIFHPYIQATVGLWKETDVTLRYSPKIKIDVSDYTIFGVAVKHSISQYFRKENNANAFEFAVLASYSTFDSNLLFDALALTPTDGNEESLAVIKGLTVNADALMFQAIGSKRWADFEMQGSLGFVSSAIDYTILGDGSSFIKLFNRTLVVLEETRNGFKGDLGANYYFGKVYVSSNVTFGKFTNLNLGIHYKI